MWSYCLPSTVLCQTEVEISQTIYLVCSRIRLSFLPLMIRMQDCKSLRFVMGGSSIWDCSCLAYFLAHKTWWSKRPYWIVWDSCTWCSPRHLPQRCNFKHKIQVILLPQPLSLESSRVSFEQNRREVPLTLGSWSFAILNVIWIVYPCRTWMSLVTYENQDIWSNMLKLETEYDQCSDR